MLEIIKIKWAFSLGFIKLFRVPLRKLLKEFWVCPTLAIWEKVEWFKDGSTFGESVIGY